MWTHSLAHWLTWFYWLFPPLFLVSTHHHFTFPYLWIKVLKYPSTDLTLWALGNEMWQSRSPKKRGKSSKDISYFPLFLFHLLLFCSSLLFMESFHFLLIFYMNMCCSSQTQLFKFAVWLCFLTWMPVLHYAEIHK